MKRVLCTVLALSAIVVLVVAVSASGEPAPHAKHRGHPGHHGKSITVIEHATSDTTTDTGASGDSVGDILTFANDVFDATNTTKAGTDQGYCVRVVAGPSYECTWTTFLPGGQIVVAGPFFMTRRTARSRSPAAPAATATRAAPWTCTRDPAAPSTPSSSTSTIEPSRPEGACPR
jgi:hypothetical protein